MFKRYSDEQKREASSSLGLLSGYASQCAAAMNHVNGLAISQGGFDEATYGVVKAEIDWVMIYYRQGLECAERIGVREDSMMADQTARSLATFFQLTDSVVICRRVSDWHQTCKHACRTLSNIAQYNPQDWKWW